jgi:hypothetical protein
MSLIEPYQKHQPTLADIIDRILEKGLVINADITVSVTGVELLGVRIRAALASFETAARYGLEFPMGTNIETEAWREAEKGRQQCPQCGMKVASQDLLYIGCSWCGWRSALAKGEISMPRKLPVKAGRIRR